jgi:hypothetical protein
MGVNRIIYNVQDLFVGPDDSNAPTHLNNLHLLQRLQRVIGVSYDVNVSRVEVKELGRNELAASPIISHPELTLSFDYNVANVANELRLGLNSNWNVSGTPAYIHNFPILSGFSNPARSYDRRNIYLTVAPSGGDSRTEYTKTWTGLSGSPFDIVDPNGKNFQVFCFANTVMTSYSVQAAVGEFVKASTQFVADEMMFFVSGSGVKVPKIDLKTRSLIASDISFAIPKAYRESQPSVLQPGDIRIDLRQIEYVNPSLVLFDNSDPNNPISFVQITSNIGYKYLLQYYDYLSGNFWKDAQIENGVGEGSDLVFTDLIYARNSSGVYRVIAWPVEMENLGALISDAKITSLGVTMNIERENINFLGYKIPVDRPVNYPIHADLNFSLIVGEGTSGSLLNLFNHDRLYDLTVTINNPHFNTVPTYEKTALKYDVGRARFVGLGFQDSIGENKTATLKFRTEIVPTSFETGFFMSGIIQSPDVLMALLQTELGEYIQTEDSFVIRAEDIIQIPTSF